VAGLTLVGAGDACRVTLEVPKTACEEESIAVTVTACCAGTFAGAVKTPLWLILPTAGLFAQVTLVPEGKFKTENCLVPAGATMAAEGVMLVGGGVAVKVKLAFPRTAWVDEFFAVTVTVSWEATLFGAV
jgi:hypothetical protein